PHRSPGRGTGALQPGPENPLAAVRKLCSDAARCVSPWQKHSRINEFGFNISIRWRFFMQPVQGLDSMPAIHQLEQTPIILEKMLHSAAPAILQWKPAAGRWSVSEVLAHLVDAEQM